ncbi:MAG: hypothetical protein P8Y45_02195 [Exilibacterium sp.]
MTTENIFRAFLEAVKGLVEAAAVEPQFSVHYAGLPTSDLTAAMALQLIIISVADAVHIVASYRYYRLAGYKHPQAMAVALSKAGLSCLLTSLTTMVAFYRSTWSSRICRRRYLAFLPHWGWG